MKALTLQAVDKWFNSSDIKPSAKLYKMNHSPSYTDYNKVLKIVIPGEPITDGRVRHNSNTDIFYNPHKNNLKKIFDRIYKDSKLLQDICIMGPMMIELKAFVPMSKKFWKLHQKILSKEEKQIFEKEEMKSFVTPDVDNYEKVHYDVLQDAAYMVILNDQEIVENRTSKYFVTDNRRARMEILVYFTDNIPDWYIETHIKPSAAFLTYTISPKYFRSNKIPESEWSRVFFQTIKNYRDTYNKNIVKTVTKFLKYLTVEELKLLSNGKTKEECINLITKAVEKIQDRKDK